MTLQIRLFAITAAMALATPSLANAQQGGGSDMSNMPGMSDMPPKSQTNAMPGMDMQGMDMQGMMKQCAQMRLQMKPGAAMSPDMSKMMAQCDEMDRGMTSAPQSYVPPAQRSR